MGFVPKRVHSPSEFDLIDTDHARKKYISEQVANAMAALSLSNRTKHSASTTFTKPPQQPPQQPPPNEEGNPAVNLVKAHINGSLLPLEQRPGDDKLRIPEFILRPPPLTAADYVRQSSRYPTVTWRAATPVEEYKIIQGQEEEDDDGDEIWTEPTPMDID